MTIDEALKRLYDCAYDRHSDFGKHMDDMDAYQAVADEIARLSGLLGERHDGLPSVKPRIGQTVWILEHDANFGEWYLTPEKAFALGAEEFVVDDYRHKTPSSWKYSDYGKKWFASFEEAKAKADRMSPGGLEWRESAGMHWAKEKEA